MGSLGALASAPAAVSQEDKGWSESILTSAFILTISFIWFCSLCICYKRAIPAPTTQRKMSKSSGIFVTKMSALAVVDNFGAGMAGALVPYWFFLSFGVELKALGIIFFASYFLAALSFLSAPVIARKIGVVKTMAFSCPGSCLSVFPWPSGLGGALLGSLVFCLHGPPLARVVYHGQGKIGGTRPAAGVTSWRAFAVRYQPDDIYLAMQSVSSPFLFIAAGYNGHDVPLLCSANFVRRRRSGVATSCPHLFLPRDAGRIRGGLNAGTAEILEQRNETSGQTTGAVP